MKDVLLPILRLSLAALLSAEVICAHAQEPSRQDTLFPIVLYNHWSQTTVQRMIEVIDNAQEHGFNTVNVFGAQEDVKVLQAHVLEKGMAISGFCDSLHPFRGKKPPGLCVHSPDYKSTLHKALEGRRTSLQSSALGQQNRPENLSRYLRQLRQDGAASIYCTGPGTARQPGGVSAFRSPSKWNRASVRLSASNGLTGTKEPS